MAYSLVDDASSHLFSFIFCFFFSDFRVTSFVLSLKVLISCSNCFRLFLSSVRVSEAVSSSSSSSSEGVGFWERPRAWVKRTWRGFLVGPARVGVGVGVGAGWEEVGLEGILRRERERVRREKRVLKIPMEGAVRNLERKREALFMGFYTS